MSNFEPNQNVNPRMYKVLVEKLDQSGPAQVGQSGESTNTPPVKRSTKFRVLQITVVTFITVSLIFLAYHFIHIASVELYNYYHDLNFKV